MRRRARRPGPAAGRRGAGLHVWRRGWRPGLLPALLPALAAALLLPGGTAPARAGEPDIQPSLAVAPDTVALATSIEAIGITVSDLERSVAFYTTVLDFEEVERFESSGPEWERLLGVFAARTRTARLRLGEETLELTEFVTPRGRPVPPDSRSNDLWFQHVAIIVGDMERAYARLAEAGVEHVSPRPQRLPDWNEAAGGIEAFYFRDPDGHVLEILAFPPGKGAPRWHAATDGLFLGIDHTAIAVSDTEASLAFYRDLLGLRVAGTSENYGPEQERLNSVFGARLRITAVRPPRGPAVEFLEYVAPRDGRPMPRDTRASDLWHWQTRVRVRDLEAAERGLRAGRYDHVSPGAVRLPDRAPGFGSGVMARDPDGHALLLVTD
ncbi:MAG: VOC family protein [Gemmatimonadota bacterium]|nr:VOC family protein [Gemmatimonadota bacterium]